MNWTAVRTLCQLSRSACTMSLLPLTPPHRQARGHIPAYPRLHFLASECTGDREREYWTVQHVDIHLHFSSLGIREARLSHPPKEFSKFHGRFCLALQAIQEPTTWEMLKGMLSQLKTMLNTHVYFWKTLGSRYSALQKSLRMTSHYILSQHWLR